MAAPGSARQDALLSMLRTLVAHASISGDDAALDHTASAVAVVMQHCGLTTTMHPTEGAPILIGHRPGRSPRHLLLYNHYDVVPSGFWRDWNHDPFLLAERENVVYGRGVVADKGNLAARLQAVAELLHTDGELPIGVTFLVEGDALHGSPHLPNLIADQAAALQADYVLGFGGVLDARSIPIIYTGVRGRLAVLLRAIGPQISLASDMATSVRNPAWRLVWALNQIKNDSEEVVIDGFYDAVVPLARESTQLLRSLDLNEAARKAAWGIDEFLFGLTGRMLARAETLNPTCNISLLQSGQGALPTIPSTAEAMIDFGLVPEQRPNDVVRLLREHLNDHDLADIELEAIYGAYPPAVTALDDPFVAMLSSQIEATYGAAPQQSPMAPFAAPLHLFTAGMHVPAIPLGLHHPAAAVRSANEQIGLESIDAMTSLIRNIITHSADSA